MKKTYFLSLVALLIFNIISAQYKVDSMCGTKVVLGKDGKMLAKYHPEIPGAAFSTVVKLAVEFYKNCPVDPVNQLPFYMTSPIISRTRDGGYSDSTWPHNPLCVHAGILQGIGIDWRNYSGDESVIGMIRKELDHQIQYGTTPASWEWGNVPYASSEAGRIIYDGASLFDTAATPTNRGRGDGSFSIEVDKIGDMEMAYLKFYQITGETKYLKEAINCADVLAKHIRTGFHTKDEIDWANLVLTSPWSFRVKAETGGSQQFLNGLLPQRIIS